MVHGVNPHGFAWQRRVNESNIDLNRNFIDFDQLPDNEPYLEVATLLEPATWDDTVESTIQDTFAELTRTKGGRWLQGAMFKGQYTHPEGFFFGGTSPAWSNDVMYSLAQKYIARASVSSALAWPHR